MRRSSRLFLGCLALALAVRPADAASFIGYDVNLDRKAVCSSGATFMGRSISDAWHMMPAQPMTAREGSVLYGVNDKFRTLKGDIAISIVLRGDIVGIVNLKSLTLERAGKDSWRIPETEFKRFKPLARMTNFVVIEIERQKTNEYRSMALLYDRPKDANHPLDFWKLLAQAPVAGTSTITADGKSHAVKGSIRVSIQAHPYFDCGDALEVGLLNMVRDDSNASCWYVSEAEFDRIRPQLKYTDPEVMKLVKAARKGDLGTVKAQLAKGIDVNAEYDVTTALDAAIYDDRREVFDYLLANGAAPGSGIIAAIDARKQDYLEVLLSKKAEIPEGALHLAAEKDQPQIAAMLLKKGADINGRDNGLTPLHEAVRYNRETMVMMLLDNGADPKLKVADSYISKWNGLNAVQLATKEGRHDIAQLLRDEMKTNGGKLKQARP
jgi:hypothetical protein